MFSTRIRSGGTKALMILSLQYLSHRVWGSGNDP